MDQPSGHHDGYLSRVKAQRVRRASDSSVDAFRFVSTLVSFAAGNLPVGAGGDVLIVGESFELARQFLVAGWQSHRTNEPAHVDQQATFDLIVATDPARRTSRVLEDCFRRLRLGGHLYFTAERHSFTAERHSELDDPAVQLADMQAAGFAAAWCPAPVFLADPLVAPERFDRWVFLGRRDI